MSALAWTFQVSETLALHVAPAGYHGAHALACLLGMRTLPLPVAATHYARPEWTDITARIRAMAAANLSFRSWPIYRQFCGCLFLAVEPARLLRDEGVTDVLDLSYCAGHRPADPETGDLVRETPLGYLKRLGVTAR